MKRELDRDLVSVVRCHNYSKEELSKAVDNLFKPYGGIKGILKGHKRVLIKPNMLSAKSAESCAITHPLLVEVIAEKCKECNAEVCIGDSPPLVNKNIEEFWERTGYINAALNTDSKLVSFERYKSNAVVIEYNSKKVHVNITNYYFESDVTFNIAKLKTHNLTRLTCAVKNHYGLIPGLLKAQLHLMFPRAEDFGGFLAELVTKIPMTVSIIDAIDAMHGFGPAHGEPIKVGLLLASINPFLVDMVISEIVNCPPTSQPTLNYAIKHNIVPRSVNEIKLVGFTNISEIKCQNFKVPNTLFIYKVPQSLYKIVKKLIWAKPASIEGMCIKCRACERICSAKAVYVENNIGVIFVHNKCISCFCCVEVCPAAAIKIQSSFILNILFLLKRLLKKIKNYVKEIIKK